MATNAGKMACYTPMHSGVQDAVRVYRFIAWMRRCRGSGGRNRLRDEQPQINLQEYLPIQLYPPGR